MFLGAGKTTFVGAGDTRPCLSQLQMLFAGASNAATLGNGFFAQ
jgi:hypothetical protein